MYDNNPQNKTKTNRPPAKKTRSASTPLGMGGLDADPHSHIKSTPKPLAVCPQAHIKNGAGGRCAPTRTYTHTRLHLHPQVPICPCRAARASVCVCVCALPTEPVHPTPSTPRGLDIDLKVGELAKLDTEGTSNAG